MPGLGRLTIRRKLTSISVLSGLTALVSASAAFLVYDIHTFRESMVRRILSEARIIGFNSVTPLLFDDPEAATLTLGGLKAEPAVIAAAIFRPQGRTAFATYARDGGAVALQAAQSGDEPGHRFDANELFVSEPIRFEGRPIGTLVIRTELLELAERQRRYATIVGIVLVGSLLLGIALSRAAEKTISGPIIRLADTARVVSSRKDYSVRAQAGGGDEIGTLVETFNEMLDQIERQDSDLKEARTELEKRVEARTRELAAANRELEAFSYSVSHDLRAPLRAIDGFSKAFLEGYSNGLDDRGRHYLDRVRAGTQRMAALIDDLLSLARISQRELIRLTVNVSEAASRVAGELANRQPEPKVQVDIEEGLTAHADPRLLAIVLENLMGNAWKFSGRKPEPRVEVGQSDGAFFVRDNGAGFEMKYVDKLFGAFQRLHTDSEFEGTGIGLATVQRIVNRHGGRIWAEGEVGKGATFYFTLEGEA